MEVSPGHYNSDYSASYLAHHFTPCVLHCPVRSLNPKMIPVISALSGDLATRSAFELLSPAMQMQAAYDEYNAQAQSTSKSRGHFMVDLCKPGHLTACLRSFQEAINCKDDNWDAQFGEAPSHGQEGCSPSASSSCLISTAACMHGSWQACLGGRLRSATVALCSPTNSNNACKLLRP